MQNNNNSDEQKKQVINDILTELLKNGAQKLLAEAIEIEIEEFIAKYKELKDKNGHQRIVRNGHLPERMIDTGIGKVAVKQPRARDKNGKIHFNSSILPRYLRRLPSIDNLIPVLYLKGISTNDFPSVLQTILGDGVKGISPANIIRLKSKWEKEFLDWEKRDLSNKEYVYFWVDGIYFNVRMQSPENKKQCILVIVGVTETGSKEIVAISDGYSESEESWTTIFRDLKARGLKNYPRLIIGDGNLGTWAAANKEFPTSKHQLCWFHKTKNVLDKMPRNIKSKAVTILREIYTSDTKENAKKEYFRFKKIFEDKYPKACKSLSDHEDKLFSFYDFPGTHWIHIRTVNIVESTFSTVRLRTRKTRGCGSRIATLSMVFKLVKECEKTWKKIKGYKYIDKIIAGVEFNNGNEKLKKAA